MIDAAPLETIVNEDEEGDSGIEIDYSVCFYYLERYVVFIEIVLFFCTLDFCIFL